MSSKELNLFDDETLSLDETNWVDFERCIREYLYELNMKRKLLEECRADLNREAIEKNELKIKLDCEKRKLEENIRENMKQSILLSKLQEERDENNEYFTRHKLEFEITRKERDSLKIQNHSQQIENEKLKKQLENLEGLHKCQLTYQRDVINEQNKIKSLFSELAVYRKNMESINKKHDECLKQLEITQQLRQSLELYEEENKKLIIENNTFQKQLITKSTEIEMFKDLLKNSPFNIRIYQEEIDHWKQKLKEKTENNEQLLNTAKVLSDTLELEKGITEHLEFLLEQYNKKTEDAGTQTEYVIKEEIVDVEGVENNEVIRVDPDTMRIDPDTIRIDPDTIRIDQDTIRTDPDLIRIDPDIIRIDTI